MTSFIYQTYQKIIDFIKNEYFVSNIKYVKTIDSLQLISALYLGIPLVLFFISWLKWYYAFVMVSLLIIPFLGFGYDFRIKVKWEHFIYFILFSLFLIFLGYGEIFPQSGDWSKHNAIFSQLYNSWNMPVFIKYMGENHILCYGLGFYFIPSWIANILNEYYIIKWLLLFNSALGLSIIGMWCFKIWKLPVWSILLIYFIGDLRFINYNINEITTNHKYFLGFIYETGFSPLLYCIDSIPQHFISIILVFLLIANQLKYNNLNLRFSFIVITFGLFWSPFLLFTIIPFLFFSQVNLKIIKSEFLYLISIFFIFFIIVGYYQIHIPVDNPKFVFLNFKLVVYRIVKNHSLSYGFKILLIFALNYKLNGLSKFDYKIIISFFVISLFYNFIEYGYYNDFEAKTTIVIKFILNIYIIKLISKYFIKSGLINRIFSTSIIILLSIIPLLAFVFITWDRYNFSSTKWMLSKNKIIELDKSLLKGSVESKYPFIIQYLGKPNRITNELMKSNP